VSNINKELNSIFIHIPKTAGSSMESIQWNMGNGHETIYDFRNVIDFSNFYKWCFVRNPWERIISAYEDCPEVWNEASSFENFIYLLHKNKKNFYLKHLSWSQIIDIGLPRDLYRIHFMPMNLLMKIDGQICMDFIGRFENLVNDWEIIQTKIGVEKLVLPKTNDRASKKNRKNSFYKEKYSQNLIDLVGELYEEDVKLFKYSF
jgi:hypothetical protein